MTDWDGYAASSELREMNKLGWEMVREMNQRSLTKAQKKNKPLEVPKKLHDQERVYQQFPGWEHDLGLVGAYKQQVASAFKSAEAKAGEIRKDAANGKMFIDGPTLRGLITEEVADTFLDALTPLWTEAWHLGYEGGKSLVTGDTPDFTKTHETGTLDNFLDTEGVHWVQQIGRTGLNRSDARAEVIARTEVSRAMNAGAIQAYKDNGITHKHLLVAPDDTCDICKNAEAEGDIPMDAIFPTGGLGGPFHPQCRCIPAPMEFNFMPPLAHLGKSEGEEDPTRVAFLMLRAPHPEKGKLHYMLQKRSKDGKWGLPGGHAHIGEDPWETAHREVTEEIGDLPSYTVKGLVTYALDNGKMAYIYLCDSPWFNPLLNGATSQETEGAGWFKKKQINKLDLHPHFQKQWDNVDWNKLDKRIGDTESGEMLTTQDDEPPLFPAGARWPYPKRSDGAEDPHYGTAATETFPSRDPGRVTADMSDHIGGPEAPGEDETDEFPKKRTPPKAGPKKLPSQEPPLESPAQNANVPSGVQNVGSSTGVPPGSDSFTKMYTDMVTGKLAPRPAVGSVPAEAPRPMQPRSVPPETYDPAESVATEEDGEIAYYPQPKKPKGKGGPADHSDANPVDAEHVYVQMAKNFPPEAIQWVKRARWTGPINVPWDRVDDDDIKSWAASHQPDHVKRFETMMQAHDGHVAPSILVQEPQTNKAFIVDGHHRALAHKNLKQPVLAYLGNIDPKDRPAALETHSKQIHHGSDPKNE